MWVAVVCKGKSTYRSGRSNGDWSCFTHLNKDKAIEEALKYAKEWSGKGHGDYQVLVGKLSMKASYHTEYDLVAI